MSTKVCDIAIIQLYSEPFLMFFSAATVCGVVCGMCVDHTHLSSCLFNYICVNALSSVLLFIFVAVFDNILLGIRKSVVCLRKMATLSTADNNFHFYN